MSTEHFVVLGLARPRTPWLTAIGQWSTSSTIPVEFIRCVSLDEIRARLHSDRRHSAVLLGEDCAGLDRDILEAARDAKCVALVVSGSTVRRDWCALGATAVLELPLTPESLMGALRDHALGVERPTLRNVHRRISEDPPSGRLITVLGGGGTGTSTTALGIAHFFASELNEGDSKTPGSVGLVDGSLNGDQARLHQLGDVVPGLQELVDLHRTTDLSPDQVRDHFWFSPRHGYHVLPGLRRRRDWTTLRRRATTAALSSVRRTFDLIVADVDDDLEGEGQTGSIDVEDRNHLARELVVNADVVVLTARAGVVGTSRVLQTIREVIEFGVDSRRILPVILCAPRSTRRRSELTQTMLLLIEEALPESRIAVPVMVPLRRDIEPFIHDGAPLPEVVLGSVATAVAQLLEVIEPPHALAGREPHPIPIVPGHLGRTA